MIIPYMERMRRESSTVYIPDMCAVADMRHFFLLYFLFVSRVHTVSCALCVVAIPKDLTVASALEVMHLAFRQFAALRPRVSGGPR